MFKVYLCKSVDYNFIIITDGETAKFFNGKNGYYCGIDLYSEEAEIKLYNFFKDLYELNCVNDYENIFCSEVFSYTDVFNSDIDKTLVFEAV